MTTTTTTNATCITDINREPLYSLIWSGLWIAALAALLLVLPTL